jgi:hypothetical protein
MPVFALVKNVAVDPRSLSGPLRAAAEAISEASDT